MKLETRFFYFLSLHAYKFVPIIKGLFGVGGWRGKGICVKCKFQDRYTIHERTVKISLRHTGAPVAQLGQLVAPEFLRGKVGS